MTEIDRGGAIWCEDDYRRLFEALASELPDDEVADYLGRSPRALAKRAHMLVCEATGMTKALGFLRRITTEPGFEWEPFIVEAHQRTGIPYWSSADDRALIEAWAAQDRPQMPHWCERFGVREDAVARRCLILGLTSSRAEVVDRFGASPGGVLHHQAVLARDKAGAAVWTLVITTADGQVVHLSLHPSWEAALLAGRGLTAEDLDEPPARWTIAVRVTGEGPVRFTISDEWGRWPEADPADLPWSPPPAAAVEAGGEKRARWWQRSRT